ncbi:MAG: divalent cation tolerance protein CutA, partial [Leptospirales bacterium]
NDREVVLIAKTRRDLFEKLRERVIEVHSYDCPCVVALDIADGHPAFLDWIAAETGDASTP